MGIRSIFYQKIGKCRRCDIIIKYWAILRTFFKGTFERVFNKSLKNCIIKTFASNITRIMQMYKNKRRFSTSSAVSKWHHIGETMVTEIGYHKDMSNTHADTKCGYCSTQHPNKISNNKINKPKKLL